MSSKRAQPFGTTADNTVKLIKSERKYLRGLNIFREEGELILALRDPEVTTPSNSPSSSPSSSPSQSRSPSPALPPTPPPTPPLTEVLPESISSFFELLFKGTGSGANKCLLSLWRLQAKEKEAVDLFQVISRLLAVLFKTANCPFTRNVQQLMLFFQRLVNTMDSHRGWREVHIAASNDYLSFFTGSKDMSAEVLNSQAPPELYTPLHCAVIQGHQAIVAYLLEQKRKVVNFRLLDGAGNSVFHLAASVSPTDLLQRLLTLAPDLRWFGSFRNTAGATPVELAAFAGRKEHLRVMIGAGLTTRALTIVSQPGETLDLANQTLLDRLDNSRLLDGGFFTPADLATGLSFNSIKLGGCPLHWTASPSLLYRLLSEPASFAADTPNIEGETALLRNVRAGRGACALTLLTAGGASPGRSARYGESPLVVAVLAGNAHLVRVLLVFGADANGVREKDGLSVRHLAAACVGSGGKKTSEAHREILAHLVAFGARPCPPSSGSESSCVPGCLENEEKTVSDKLKAIYEGPFHNNTAHQVAVEKLLKEKVEGSTSTSSAEGSSKGSSKTPVMMICFDGGGVRGLLTVQILLELSQYLSAPLPEYFDWIGGTSTGSIIGAAVASGRSVTEIQALYFRFKDTVLSSGKGGEGSSDTTTTTDIERGGKGGNASAKKAAKPYSSENLEGLLKREFGAETKLAELPRRLEGSGRQQVMLVAAARVDRIPARLTLFSSASEEGMETEETSFPAAEVTTPLPRSQASVRNLEVWRALRASSAAPTFFKSYPPFVDGGILANNPTVDCIAEYVRTRLTPQKQGRKSQGEEEEELSLVLSMGTGAQQANLSNHRGNIFNQLLLIRNLKTIPVKKAITNLAPFVGDMLAVGKLLQSIATNANHPVVGRAETWAASLGAVYFRLNVPLAFKMELDETDDGVIMRALLEVRLWARTNAGELRKLAEVMEALLERKKKRWAKKSKEGSQISEQQQQKRDLSFIE